MRGRHCLASCGLLLLGACAEAPLQPAQPSTVTVAKAPVHDAAAVVIAEHRERARRHARAGNHAEAELEWQIVLLLAPADDAARAELEAARTAIRRGVGDHLQAGRSALRAGDTDRAAVAMLKVLALEPENVEASKALRDIDRQKLNRIQGNRAARAGQTGASGASRSAAGAATMPDAGDSYEIEQSIEIFRAGDLEGGLREFRAFVDANPRNEAARVRIASLVYERSVEAEQKGAREQALTLCEQAESFRGKPVPEWTARARSLRKALSAEYYERGMRAYRTDIASAITLWETSLRYDPQNRSAQSRLQEARVAAERLKRIEREKQQR
jgi:tetratricopeptide (TPR) repeat protein